MHACEDLRPSRKEDMRYGICSSNCIISYRSSIELIGTKNSPADRQTDGQNRSILLNQQTRLDSTQLNPSPSHTKSNHIKPTQILTLPSFPLPSQEKKKEKRKKYNQSLTTKTQNPKPKPKPKPKQATQPSLKTTPAQNSTPHHTK